MSEFSIEEKANAYDVALKKAKTLLSKCKCDRDRTTMIYCAEDIESIFPELKGSINHIKDSDVLAWMELSDLDKSFDKIKPKFKVGDWVSNGACTWRIDLIEDDLYCSNCDKFTCGGDIKSIDEQYHLWTIEDAKDGDILSYVTDDGNLWIMIYQSLYKPYKNHVHYHALLVDDDFTDGGTCYIDVDYLKPATREQCGLLFKRMQESGYIWDANKKELIKL